MGPIRRVLKRIPQTLADAKRTTRDIESLDRDHERLWRNEDELIPQFIPIRPRVVAGEPVKYKSQVPYALVDADPRPLAVNKSAPLLAFPTPRVDPPFFPGLALCTSCMLQM